MVVRVLLLLLVASSARAGSPLDALRKRFGFAVVVQKERYERRTLHGTLSYDEPDAASVDRFARLLVEEFSRYPVAFVKASGLRGIVVCRGLSFGGQKRAALPDRDRWLLIYDATAAPSRPDYARHVIHHEYFHLVDWVGDSWAWRMRQWKRLNEKGFRYGEGGHTVQDDRYAWLLETGSKGFLNRYSKSSVREDMAEVFAFLMMRKETVAERCSKDKFLDAKVRLLKRHLKTFDGSMDAEFWKHGKATGEKDRREPPVAAAPPEPSSPEPAEKR